jgi:Uma2 family endonuclease
MVTALKKQKYTLEEYFELERNSEEKFEFWDGTVWCMSGASIVHEDIVSYTLRSLGDRLSEDCHVSASNVRVKVPIYPPYRYPDLTVVCGKRQIETVSGLEMLVNPQIIIEVLSPSTEAFDRGAKFTYYKSIESLCEYILIATDHAYVTQIIKSPKGEWIHRDVEGIDSILSLPTFNLEIPLSQIYRDVEFHPVGYVDPETERSLQGR